MKAEEKKVQSKVGIFVLIGLVLTLSAILVLGGKQSIFTPVNDYYSHFPKVDGLVSGAKITMGGLQVGSVRKVEFDPITRDIKVYFSVETRYAEWVRKDSSVELATQGVLGDKYLALLPGNPAEPLVPPGGEVQQVKGRDFSQLVSSSEKLMERFTATAEELEKALAAFNRNDRSNQIFQNLAVTTKNLGELTTKLNAEISQMKFKSAINHLNSILQKMDHGQGTVGAFINDPALYDDIKALVGQVNRNRIVRNLIRQSIKDNKQKAVDEEKEKEKQ